MTREGKIIKIKLLEKCHGEGGKRENQGKWKEENEKEGAKWQRGRGKRKNKGQYDKVVEKKKKRRWITMGRRQKREEKDCQDWKERKTIRKKRNKSGRKRRR